MRGLIFALIGLSIIGAIAVGLGVALGSGEFGMSIFLFQGLIVLVFAMLRPEFGIFTFLAVNYFVAFLPEQLQLNEIAGYYVFGLNPKNVTLAIVVASFLIHFLTRDRASGPVFKPMGPLGKWIFILLLVYLVQSARSMLAADLSAYAQYYETPLAYVALGRAYLIPLTISLIILQVNVKQQFLTRLVIFLTVLFIAQSFWGTYHVSTGLSRAWAGGDLAATLRRSPVNLQTLALAGFGVFVALSFVSKSVMQKVIWITAAILLLIPIAYLRRRSTYFGVLVELLLVLFLTTRTNPSHRRAAILISLAFVGIGMFYLPTVVIDRLAGTITSTGSDGTHFEGSVAARFLFWEIAVKSIMENWHAILWGHGMATGPVIMRQHIGSGTSFHNYWLQTLIEFGTIGIVASVMLFYHMMRIFVAVSRSGQSPLVTSFAIAFAASVISYQTWTIAHSTGFEGSLGFTQMLLASTMVTQMRPGGTLARIKMWDGRMAIEHLGYDPKEHPEVEEVQNLPPTLGIPGRACNIPQKAPARPAGMRV